MRILFPLGITVLMFSQALAQSDSLLSAPFVEQITRNFVGSYGQIHAPKKTPFPIGTLEQLVTGRIAGLQVMQTSGAPNSVFSLRLRGTGALYGSAEPLIVIDGVPMNTQYGVLTNNNFFIQGKARYDINPLSVINPYDIESITVHKDAIGTAMYGGRAINGLVLITTKKGSESPLRITYEASHSVQTMARRPQLLNATSYAQRVNEIWVQNNMPPRYPNPEELGKGTDWLRAISQLGGISQHHLQAAGGISHLSYMASIGYFRHNGVIQSTNTGRLSGRVSLVSNWWRNRISVGFNGWVGNMSTNMMGQYELYNDSFLNPVSQAIRYSPVLPIYNADGSFLRSSPNMYNPVELIQSSAHQIHQFDLQYNAFLHINITKNLSWKTQYGSWSSQNDRFGNDNGPSTLPWFSQMIADITNKHLETCLDYRLALKKHTFELTTGLSRQMEGLNYVHQNSSDATLISDNAIKLRKDINYYQKITGVGIQINTLETGWNAFFGQIKYSYANRLNFSLSQRRELNSNLISPNHTTTSNAIGAAWVMLERLRNQETLLLTAKVTHGWSTIQSPNEPPSAYFSNPFYLPKQAHTNLGFEIKKGIIRSTIDIYHRSSKNILYQYVVPSTTGSTPYVNSGGTLKNQGIEVSFQFDDANNKLFKHSSYFTGAFQKNRLSNLEYPTLYGKYNALIENRPANSWQVFTIEKLDANGQAVYKDTDKDGVPDLNWAGTANPSFLWGIQQQLVYKNMDFSLLIRGEHGQKILNNALLANLTSATSNITTQFYHNQWRPTNQNAIYPSPFANTLSRSNIFLENGSFVRLQWMSIGYTLPPSNYLRNCRFYISGQNLFLLTKYSSLDPEVNAYGQDTANRGIDYDSYPRARTYTIGIQVQL